MVQEMLSSLQMLNLGGDRSEKNRGNEQTECSDCASCSEFDPRTSLLPLLQTPVSEREQPEEGTRRCTKKCNYMSSFSIFCRPSACSGYMHTYFRPLNQMQTMSHPDPRPPPPSFPSLLHLFPRSPQRYELPLAIIHRIIQSSSCHSCMNRRIMRQKEVSHFLPLTSASQTGLRKKGGMQW